MPKAIGVAGAGVSFVLVFAVEILAIIVTFLYLLDKGWGIILGGIIAISVIGAIITAFYAAFFDGHWWPLLLGTGGVLIQVIGGTFAMLTEDEAR